jgi:hypothetical protein
LATLKNTLFLLLFLSSGLALSQGIYTDFGQNRRNNKIIQWERLLLGADEILTEKGNNLIAQTVSKQFLIEKKNLERSLEYQLRSGVKVIIYSHFADYLQGNFSLTDEQFYAGGYIYTPHNELFVYFNGDYKELMTAIKKGVARILINEMVLGGTMLDRAQSSALLTLPEWFVGGLASYLGADWSTQMDNRMRDAFFEGSFKDFASLEKDQLIFAGHSIWYYIHQQFGADKIKNILFQTRFTRSVESGISFYTNLSMRGLFKEWNAFFSKRYEDESLFSAPRGEENKLNKQAKNPHSGLSLSPDGKQLAFVTHNRGAYTIWAYSLANKQARTIQKGGLKTYTREPNYLFPVVKWRTNREIAVLELVHNKPTLQSYSVKGNGKKIFAALDSFDWVKDFAFSIDGKQLAVVGIRNGASNIYILDDKNGNWNQITHSLFTKSDLSFTADNNLLFVSTEAPGTLENVLFNGRNGVFLFDFQRNEIKRITPIDTEIDCIQPLHLGGDYYTFLSDLEGIYNSYSLAYTDGQNPSFKDFKKQTHYNRSILYQSTSATYLAELVFIQSKYRIYVSSLLSDDFKNAQFPLFENETYYRKLRGTRSKVQVNWAQTLLTEQDSKPADSLSIKSKFKDSGRVFQSRFPIIDYDPYTSAEEGSLATMAPRIKQMENIFQVHYFMLKFFDNSIWGDYYFQGGVDQEIMQNPLFSPSFTFSIGDPFNDHRFEMGARVSGMLNGSDYVFKYTYQKGILDKFVFFNRRARYFDLSDRFQRNIMTLGGLGFVFPVSEKLRLEWLIQLRNDQHLDLGIDSASVFNPDPTWILLGNKFQVVYDNTVSFGLNQLLGTRIKFFADPHLGLNKQGNNTMLGVDARVYSRLHKNITWANRLVANTSLGNSKTAYLLGGPENWYLPQVDNNLGELAEGSQTMFQTIGAPVRGFMRNVRSGNSYVTMNTEVRIPLFSYLTQKPIKQEWIRSIMLIGFADFGAAWIGTNPYSTGNAYNTTYYRFPNYDLTVVARKNPFVVGTGIGARIKLDSYYLKYDRAYGLKEGIWGGVVHHFSLGLDF